LDFLINGILQNLSLEDLFYTSNEDGLICFEEWRDKGYEGKYVT
jgi:hypothetical protein